jgi:Tfp pilus assembly protein PilF
VSAKGPRVRPTRRAWAEIGGAALLGIVALFILVRTALDARRASAIRDAYHAYYATGGGGLAVVNDALDRASGDPSLLLLKAAVLAARGEGPSRLVDVYEVARKAASGPGEAQRAAWARLGLGVADLLAARTAPSTSLFAAAEKELAAARKDLPRRPEPHALLAALQLERGDLDKAAESIEAAERAAEVPSQGGLVTLYAAKAELLRRRGETAREVALLEKAVLAAPAQAALRDRLARAIGRRTADPRLDPAQAKAAIADADRAILGIEPLEGHRKGLLYGLEPRHVATIREGIAVAQARAGDLDRARQTLADALRDASAERSVKVNAAAVFGRLWRAEKGDAPRRGYAREAAQMLDSAARIPGTEPKEALPLFLAAALFYREAEQYENAVRTLDLAAKIAPEDVEVLRAYGVCYDSWRRTNEAIDAYRRAIARAPAETISLAMEERIRILQSRERR